MAVLAGDKKSVTVERGDMLSQIALDYKSYTGGLSYKQLASINGISNPDLIYIGQVIKFTGTATSKKSNNSSKVIINHFGIQSNSDNTLFATWTWSRSNTENYEIEWYYDTGDSVWFVGTKSTTEDKQATYSIPSNAKRVRFRVKPISKTYKSNDKETRYWTASWSSFKVYNIKDRPPGTPSTPTVKIEKYTLTAELANIDTEINATGIQFQVCRGTTTSWKTCKVTIRNRYAICQFSVDAGYKYQVRCRSYRGNEYSAWSDYSAYESTIPATPKGLTARAVSENAVYLEWTSAAAAEKYYYEYATKLEYFDATDQTTSAEASTETHFTIHDLESGNEYFFRIKANNDKGDSGWSDITSVVIGEPPSAPTTWSSTTTAIVDEPVILYWMHNSIDGSNETHATIVLYVDDKEQVPIIVSRDSEDDSAFSYYELDTSKCIEGTTIKWKVMTTGVTNEYGDWSVTRTINVYAQPTLEINITNSTGEAFDVLTSFPFYIYALAGPNTQKPIGYYVTITANESYETVDSVGNTMNVNIGDIVYYKYIDNLDADDNYALNLEINPSNVNLDNNISYTVTCTAAMNSGLMVEESYDFTVEWDDITYTPNASIGIDNDIVAAYIRPYCEDYKLVFYKVEYDGGIYTTTTDVVEIAEGIPVEITVSSGSETTTENVYTATNEQVFSGTTSDGAEIYYCTVEEAYMVENVTLAVYRREFDGTFTEIGSGIANGTNTYVTDPHPSLDYARYRIVATTNDTGTVSYYDVPGYPVGEKAIIIQWDEAWSYFDVNNEDELAEPPWSGSLLRLPYNIDVSDSHSSDVELIEYIGRSHPVSYYGTHLGESSSWSVEIPKDDKETLYALRRLAIWMGDVYVREPSGSGYWANISVSFSQKHCEVTIPVTLDITRVEGGI